MSNSHATGIGPIFSPPEKKESSFQRQSSFQRGIEPVLFLLEIDPRHFYAYWEVSPEDLSIIGEQLGSIFPQSQLTLRVYEGKGKEQSIPYFDIPIEGWKNDWYIEVSQPDKAYYAELGLKLLSSGEFYVIHRSNAIKTPKDTISFSQPEQWMEVLGEYERVGLSSPEEPIQISLPKTPIDRKQASLSQGRISRKMVEEYYLNLSQNCMPKAAGEERKDVLVRQPISPQGKEPSSFEQSPEKPPVFLPEMEGQKYADREGLFLNLSSLMITSRGSSIPSLSPGNLSSYSGLSSYSSGSLSSYSGSYSSLSSGHLSSGQNRENTSSEKIFHEELFQCDLDLVIYGKAQLGATLYIGEDNVEVQPDGTFSWRLNLGQGGTFWLPLRAVLPGGKEICESIPLWLQRIKKNQEE